CFVLVRSDVASEVGGLTRQTLVRRVALRPRVLVGLRSTPTQGCMRGGRRGHADEGHAACPPLTWSFDVLRFPGVGQGHGPELTSRNETTSIVHGYLLANAPAGN